MGMLRIISHRGDDRLCWKEQDALAGDAEALAALREEATTVKAAHTQDQCFIPAEMGCGTIGVEQIETHEGEDDDEIGH